MNSQTQPSSVESIKPNWRQVGWYLLLTFGLTWSIDLALYLAGGLTNPSTKLLLQFQMLMPAFCALLLGYFFFKDNPIFRTRHLVRWFIYLYFLMTGLYLAGSIACLVNPDLTTSLSLVLLLPSVVGLILLVVLRLKGSKQAFAGTGMAGGKARIWFVCGLGLVIFYGLQSWFNLLFKLGSIVDLKVAFPQFAASQLPESTFLLSTAFNALILGPFLGLIITFGEEYGWRGFLQTELMRLGRIRGVLLLGLIWGIWHWPVIWMGYNYPGQPLLGSIFMVAYCIILAYFLAYAVLKSNGLWTAAYLHALNNQSLSFFVMFLVTPSSVIYSFGIGLPALLIGALVVALILRDPIWKESEPVRPSL